MLTEKDYCDYETCVALKKLGYNGTPGECSHFGAFYMNEKEIFYDRLYNSELNENECLRVPLYLAQKWLREEKKIEVVVLGEKEIGGPYYADIYTESGYAGYVHKPCEKYEEALAEGVRGAVKILKEK